MPINRLTPKDKKSIKIIQYYDTVAHYYYTHTHIPHNAAQRISELKRFLYLRISGVSEAKS